MANQVTFTSIEPKLINVDFESIDENTKNQNFSVSITDDYSLESFTGTEFNILYSRKINLVPDTLFKLVFKYAINFKLNNLSVNHFNNDVEKVKDFLNRRFITIMNEQNILTDISTMTSILTKYANFKPLLVAPIIKDKKSK